jgi:hypothetical protein
MGRFPISHHVFGLGILERFGFVAGRASPADRRDNGPYGGRQAALVEPYRGKRVAMAGPLEVLVAADTPQEIVAWLAEHERRATYGILGFRSTTGKPEAADYCLDVEREPES